MSLDWHRHREAWPLAAHSRFVETGRRRWHVQVLGQGPALLLIHGTGASAHSWRDLLPRLAENHTVIAVDLLGHGFTPQPRGMPLTLPTMAKGIAAVTDQLGLTPRIVVGHSAGAAVALRMVLDGDIAPDAVIGINSALTPFPGYGFWGFRLLTRAMFLNPLAPSLFVQMAGRRANVERVLENTGSRLDGAGVSLYQTLFANRAHITATLSMMANWDLGPLIRDLPALESPLHLITADRDLAVPPHTAREIREILPSADIIPLKNLGHLAHEEAPADLAGLIDKLAQA